MPSLRKIAASLQTAWSMVGLALLLLIAIDAALGRFFVRRTEGQFSRYITNYPDPDHGWVADYLREAREAERVGWQPYVYWRRLPYEGPVFHVEPSGRRHTWNAAHAAGDRVTRIFMFGGSTMWGTSARADYNLPSWLSRRLTDAGYRVEVTNFGEGGYVSTQELIALLLELRSGNVPDIAIFYDGLNDTGSAYQNRRAGWTQNEENRFSEFRADDKRPLLQKTVNLFPAILRFANGLGQRFAKPYRVDEEEAQRLETDVDRVYRENVRIIASLAQTYGFQVLCYLQPTIYGKNVLAPNEAVAAADVASSRAFLEGAYALLRGDPFLKAAPQFRDLSEIFRSTDFAVFADPYHLSERGNSIVAQRMAEDLRAVLAAPSTP